MKIGVVVVVMLLVGSFLAHALIDDPGYVVISFRNYLVEMSVPVLIGMLAAAAVTAWLTVKVLRAPRRLGEAAGRYRAERAGQKLTRGMIQIAEGNYARGEKLITRAAAGSDAPLLNYLQAARAAHLLGNGERRDEWLKTAYEDIPDAENAILLTQAEFQIDEERYESALATLKRIEESSPNHGYALTLLGRLYYRLEDWRQLAELMPRLRKHTQIDPDTLAEWATRVHLEELAVAPDEASVDGRWNTVSKDLKRSLPLRVAYLEALKRTGASDAAEKQIAKAMKRSFEPALADIYGTLDSSDLSRQLKRAEAWLGDHPDDPDLLLAAARLCIRNEFWGKARSYLETAIALRPTPDVYQEYGRLLMRLGEADAAAQAYRDGLGMVAHSMLPAIPHLPDPDAESEADSADE